MTTVFILGAGFSKCADIPIQAEFSTLLLSEEFDSDLDLAITKNLSRFLADVFGWRAGTAFPSLEDVFTCIDLASGSGHHLGIKYTPKVLRALRRMAIYRVFAVLDRRFKHSEDITTVLRATLPHTAGFIVLNWDIVLEKHLTVLAVQRQINYCCEAYDWNGPQFTVADNSSESAIRLCKMHGSSNWVYCENCRTLYYDLWEKLSFHKKVGLIKADFRLFNEGLQNTEFDGALRLQAGSRHCPRCNNMVSSHIATFSYRKSFRTHAYPAIWHAAEELLAQAKDWVFIGYSLPKADFELKHLLKTAQLQLAHRNHRPRLTVVVKGEDARSEYAQFFGSDQFTYISGGLQEYAEALAAKPLT